MHYLTSDRKLLICRQGMKISTLMPFAPGVNVFNIMMEGNNCSWFLPADQPFEMGEKGRLFHQGWDDYAPWMSGAYGTVGANHGSSYTFRITMLRHWYTAEDLGKELFDEKGNAFVIVALEDASSFLVHGRPRPGAEPLFPQEIAGALYDGDKKIEADTIKKIQMCKTPFSQLSPQNRYNSLALFADGTELEEGKVTLCSSAKLLWDYDLILTDTQVAYMLNHPGIEVTPVDRRLDPSINHKIEVTFLPDCAWHYKAEVTVKRDLPGHWHWGLLQHYGTVGFEKHEKMIPKLKPILLENGERADLDSPYEVTYPTTLRHRCTGEDCFEPNDPPNSYIDFFGSREKRELAVVLDYSLTCGITRKGSGERGDHNCTLPFTTKIYPYAAEFPQGMREGENFVLHACRQYFSPARSQATACYGRMESDGYFLYAQYHEAVSEKLQLPQELAGKPFEVVESKGGITLSCKDDGTLSVTAPGRSSFVLRFRSDS